MSNIMHSASRTTLPGNSSLQALPQRDEERIGPTPIVSVNRMVGLLKEQVENQSEGNRTNESALVKSAIRAIVCSATAAKDGQAITAKVISRKNSSTEIQAAKVHLKEGLDSANIMHNKANEVKEMFFKLKHECSTHTIPRPLDQQQNNVTLEELSACTGDLAKWWSEIELQIKAQSIRISIEDTMIRTIPENFSSARQISIQKKWMYIHDAYQHYCNEISNLFHSNGLSNDLITMHKSETTDSDAVRTAGYDRSQIRDELPQNTTNQAESSRLNRGYSHINTQANNLASSNDVKAGCFSSVHCTIM